MLNVADSRLSVGGRLGMIVPAELLQVTYSAQLRKYLVDRFERIEIVACNEMFFPNAEQEVVLLFAEGSFQLCILFPRCKTVVALEPHAIKRFPMRWINESGTILPTPCAKALRLDAGLFRATT